MFAPRSALLCVILALSLPAAAQTTYRWIDKASGKTVFSDQPPPPGTKAVSVKEGEKPAGEDRPQNYATRQAAEKYPVILYTTGSCTEVCANARALLKDRGVPFSERLLKSQEELVKQLGNDSPVPVMKVGAQSLAGFEAGAWNNLLDLAGYPKSAAPGNAAK